MKPSTNNAELLEDDLEVPQGVRNWSVVDTTPGSDRTNPLAPPAGFEGDAAAYRALMRARWRFPFQQFLFVIARRNPRLTGPYANTAAQVLVAIRRSSVSRSESAAA